MFRDHIRRPIALVSLVSVATLATGDAARAQCSGNEDQKLVASDAAADDFLGTSVAAYGDLIVAGAYRDDDAASDSGALYVFRFDGSQWIEEQELHAGDPSGGEFLGISSGVSGDVIVGGASLDNAPGTNSGSAYVYRYNGVQWVEEQKLTASDGDDGDRFGRAIAVSGDVVLVGAHWDDDLGAASGSAYVYRHDGIQWVEEQKLNASDATVSRQFGRSVSVDGDTIVVGSNDDHAGLLTGSAYVFRFDGTRWVEQRKLTSSDADKFDSFGQSVAVAGDAIAIGAPGDDDTANRTGSVYTYGRVDLALDAADVATAGDTLTLSTCGGLQGAGAALFLIDLNGSPTVLSIAAGLFDSDGRWNVAGTVPTGLAGVVATFQSFGFFAPVKIGRSNPEIVSFQ